MVQRIRIIDDRHAVHAGVEFDDAAGGAADLDLDRPGGIEQRKRRDRHGVEVDHELGLPARRDVRRPHRRELLDCGLGRRARRDRVRLSDRRSRARIPREIGRSRMTYE
ncbi:MAG: hypothetical protein IRY85_10170 [Micromonosporaceae bacterium]|nr:hypothetical protein [Micromonosporaceae bacterium]